MFKFMMIFRKPADLDSFENRYNDLLALVERMPHIIRRQVISVTGSPTGESPYYRILEVYFEDTKHMADSLMSPAGQEAGSEVMKFQEGTFDMLFADVYEETGGSTPADQNTENEETEEP